MYRIKDELGAYFFDRAVSQFGMAVEEDIRKATKNAKTEQESRRKSEQTLARWLGTKQQFRDPVGAAGISTEQAGSVSL